MRHCRVAVLGLGPGHSLRTAPCSDAVGCLRKTKVHLWAVMELLYRVEHPRQSGGSGALRGARY